MLGAKLKITRGLKIFFLIFRLLLISGASPDTVLDPGTKETLVSRFSALGNIEMVNLLTEFGADANAPNSQGMTPMMAAAARGNPMVVQQLVHGGKPRLYFPDK